MSAIIIVIILLVLVVILALVGFSMYNGFVKGRNRIQESWRQVDVELNRRYELLPNLVETVRAYAAHERNTLEDVTRLRNQAASIAQSDSGGLPSAQRSAGRGAAVRRGPQPDRERRGLPRPQEQPELPRPAVAAGRDRGPDRERPALLQRQRRGVQHPGRVGAEQHHRGARALREGDLLRGERPGRAPGAERQLRRDRLPRRPARLVPAAAGPGQFEPPAAAVPPARRSSRTTACPTRRPPAGYTPPSYAPPAQQGQPVPAATSPRRASRAQPGSPAPAGTSPRRPDRPAPRPLPGAR